MSPILCWRAIGRIGRDVLAGILWIQQFCKDVAVMHFGTAYLIATDQLVFHIRRDMVLVAEEILPVFLGPAGVNIFLAMFVIIPVFGCFAFFYPLILFTAVALYRHSDNTGINDLSFLSPKAMIMEEGLKSSKQRFDHVGLGQVFTKPPDGCAVWNLAGGMKSKEAGEGVAVEDLKFQGFIGQTIQRLQNQDLEKQNAVKTLGPGIGFSFLFPSLVDNRPENFPINDFDNLGQWITGPYRCDEDVYQNREIQAVS